jgi:hypothetical protein
VAQLTDPLATMIATGTFTPVRVCPQDVPVDPGALAAPGAPGEAADEHPATAARPSAYTAASVAAAPRPLIVKVAPFRSVAVSPRG